MQASRVAAAAAASGSATLVTTATSLSTSLGVTRRRPTAPPTSASSTSPDPIPSTGWILRSEAARTTTRARSMRRCLLGIRIRNMRLLQLWRRRTRRR